MESVYELTEAARVSTTKKENKSIQRMLDEIFSAGGVSLYVLSQIGIHVPLSMFCDSSQRNEVALQGVLTRIRNEYKRIALESVVSKVGVARQVQQKRKPETAVFELPTVPLSSRLNRVEQQFVDSSSQIKDVAVTLDVKDHHASPLECLSEEQLYVRGRAVFDPTRVYRCPVHFSGEVVVMCQCGKCLGDMLNVPFKKVHGCNCPNVSVVDGVQYVKRCTRQSSRAYTIVLPHVSDIDDNCVSQHPFGPMLIGLRDRLPLASAECSELFAGCTDYHVTNKILGGDFVSGFHAVLMYAMVLYKVRDVIVVPSDRLAGVINNRVYDGMLWAVREFRRSLGIARRQFSSQMKDRSFVLGRFSGDVDGVRQPISSKLAALPKSIFAKSTPSLGSGQCLHCNEFVARDKLSVHMGSCQTGYLNRLLV